MKEKVVKSFKCFEELERVCLNKQIFKYYDKFFEFLKV